MARAGHFITPLKPSVNVCTVKVGHHVLKTIIIIIMIKKIYLYCFVFLYYTNEIRQFKSRQLKSKVSLAVREEQQVKAEETLHRH